MMKHSQAQFRALGNMGDVLLKTEDGSSASEAVAVYGRQLALAKQLRDRGFEAAAFGSLGVCHRRAGQFDKALAYMDKAVKVRTKLHKNSDMSEYMRGGWSQG